LALIIPGCFRLLPGKMKEGRGAEYPLFTGGSDCFVVSKPEPGQKHEKQGFSLEGLVGASPWGFTTSGEGRREKRLEQRESSRRSRDEAFGRMPKQIPPEHQTTPSLHEVELLATSGFAGSTASGLGGIRRILHLRNSEAGSEKGQAEFSALKAGCGILVLSAVEFPRGCTQTGEVRI